MLTHAHCLHLLTGRRATCASQHLSLLLAVPLLLLLLLLLLPVVELHEVGVVGRSRRTREAGQSSTKEVC